MTNEPAPIRAHSAGNVVLAAANGLLVSGGNDHLAKLWNAATGDLIATLPHPATILQVEWTRDGKRFVTRDALGSIRVWRIPAETESARFPFGAALLGRPSLSARGDLLVAVNAGRHVGMWQRTRAAWRKAETSLVNYAKLALASPDGSSYLTARTENGKGTVELWDVNSKRQTNRLAHDSPITAVQFRGDGQRLFTGTAAGRAFIWDVANATPERSFVHSGAVRCGAFGVDNRAILIGGDADAGGGEARVWSLEKAGEPLSPPLRHSDSVAAVAWETGGNTVRTCDARHLVRRWDIATGRQLPPPAPFSADAQVVAYNLAGDQCLVLEADNSLRLLVSGGKFVTLPVPMSSDWKSAMFSADGRWLLTAWSDGVRIWHAATGAAIGPTLKVTNLIDAEFVQDQPSILAWSETEATLFTLRAPLISTAAGWQRKLEMSSGMDWHMHGRPRFLDATEWKKFSAQ
jgi:WD40 repeat protein